MQLKLDLPCLCRSLVAAEGRTCLFRLQRLFAHLLRENEGISLATLRGQLQRDALFAKKPRVGGSQTRLSQRTGRGIFGAGLRYC